MFKQIDRILSSATVALLILCSSSAFAVQVGGSGPINPVSIPGSLEVNQLVVSTTIETVQGVKLGMGDSAGTIRWTGSNFEGFDGSSWKALDVQSTSVGWTEDVPGNKVYVTDTARNVGIGTTEPATRLHVSGNAKVTGFMNAGWLSWFGTSLDSESPDALVFNNRGLTLLGDAEIPTLAGAKDLEAVGIHKTLVIVGDIPDDADATLVMVNNYTDASYFYLQSFDNAGDVFVSGASIGEAGIEVTPFGQYLVNTDLLTVTGTVETGGGIKFSDATVQTTAVTASGWTEDVPGNKVYVTDTGRNVGIGTSETAAKLDVGGSVLARGNITAEGILGSSGVDIDTGGDTSLTTANHTFDLGFLIEGLYVMAPVLNAESMSSMPEVIPFPHALGFYDKVAIIDKSDTGESELLFSKSTLADDSASLIADYSNQMFVLNWDLCAEPGEEDAPVYSIGKPSQKWKDAYFSGNVTVDGIKLSDGQLITSLAPASIQVAFDGGGTAIAEAAILDVVVPFNCTIESVTLLAQQTGSIVVDIWKDVYDNYPPTVDDTITASAKPTISSGVKSRDAVLTGWTTHLSADDIIRFKVDSCSGIENCLVILSVIRN